MKVAVSGFKPITGEANGIKLAASDQMVLFGFKVVVKLKEEVCPHLTSFLSFDSVLQKINEPKAP